MSSFSDWQNQNCFAWTVERPPDTRPRYSPKFTVNGNEINLIFSFCKEDETYELEAEAKRPWDPPFWISVLVQELLSKRFALPQTHTLLCPYGNLCIWKYSKSEILKAIPDCMTDGILKFLIIFPEQNKTNFTFEIKHPEAYQLDKSVQTEEEKRDQTILSADNTLPCLQALSDDLSKLVDNDDSDVVLICRDQRLKAHRNILIARSGVFAAALSNVAEGRTGSFRVQGVKPAIFRQFVRYLHTGTLPNLTVETARQFYEAGSSYAVQSLTKRCSRFLSVNLGPKNACQTLVLADNHKDQDFKEMVITFILQRGIPLMENHWMVFSKGHPILATEVLYRFYKSQRSN